MAAQKKRAKKTAKKKTAKKVNTTKKVAAKKKTAKKKVTEKKKVKAKKKMTTKKKTATKKKTTAKKKVTAKKVAKKSPAKAKPAAKKKVVKNVEAKKTKKTATVKKTRKKATTSKAKKKEKQEKALQKSVDAKKAGSSVKFVIDLPTKKAKRDVAPGVVIDKKNSVVKREPNQGDTEIRKLTAKELRTIHEMLIDKRETLLVEIKHQVGDSLGRNSTLKADAFDRATDAYDGDVSYEMIKAGHRELIEIEAALKKIEKKTYGKCEACGCNISSTRLKVKPFASFCSGCKAIQENSDSSENDDSIWGFLDSDSDDITEDNM